jgi:hypothetical protein
MAGHAMKARRSRTKRRKSRAKKKEFIQVSESEKGR